MPRVAALYRYPVKGFTPERPDMVTIGADGRVAGDRVLGLRLADNPAADDEWSSKHGMLVLVNTPGIARLTVRFDDRARRLHVSQDGEVLVDESIDDTGGRARIAAAVQEYALTLDESPLRNRPERLPLRLVGDGVTPRFQDRDTGIISMHGRGSMVALGEAIEDGHLDEVRFRSNVAVEGLEPWEELSWEEGAKIRIGNMTFDVPKGLVRCLATHANPATGERDRDVMNTLVRAFGQEQPTFAVSLRPLAPGELHIGDELEVLSRG